MGMNRGLDLDKNLWGDMMFAVCGRGKRGETLTHASARMVQNSTREVNRDGHAHNDSANRDESLQ